MSLLTIERSSSSDNLSQLSGDFDTDEDQIDADTKEDVFSRSRTSSFEGFFASKGAAFAIPDGDFARKASLRGGELQSHLQGMVNMIRDEDTMRLVVKLESQAMYTRYLSIVTTYGINEEEESVVLGFDWIEENVTIGLVIPLWSTVATGLDGDGGFEIKTEHRNYIFKPVSVQCMWTALQWIHRCLATAHRAKHFAGGVSHGWVGHYSDRISSSNECIFFWESLDELQNKRDINLSYFDKVKTDEELLKGSIRHKLKEILTRFDLEEVTCRQVREELECEMKMSLEHLKSYVDEQMFSILGQMDSSSKITDTLYLGSEWNASNLEELKDNGIGYILNVTIEIDNFFPGTFEYMNIRLHDLEESDLLRHWGKTYRFLHKAKEKGSSALVHCRRGISRSASTVVAYLMKEHNMSLHDAMKLVKSKRSIVQPNAGFWKQLIIYEGILKSSRNRHSNLFRRRSNSDSTDVRRSHKKCRERHKKEKFPETDRVDGSPEHAHTLPKMTCTHDITSELNGEPVLTRVQETINSQEETADISHPSLAQSSTTWSSQDSSESSNEGSPSDSEEEESSRKNSTRLRRTHSEPVMKHEEHFTESLPVLRKPRAKTLVEGSTSDGDAYGDLRLPTDVSEILEKENYNFSVDTGESRDGCCRGGEIGAGANLQLQSSTSVDTSMAFVVENPETQQSEESNLDVSKEDIGKRVVCGTDLSTESSDDVFVGPTNAGDPTNNDEDFTVPKNVEGDTSVGDEAPEALQSDGQMGNDGDEMDLDIGSEEVKGSRPRSRSIGEKLETKQPLKHSKSESSEVVRKIEGRGRVRRRERKAKSDLQLTNSGFVKRHTQIIEEQMLYSMLQNSEKTLASFSIHCSENEARTMNVDFPIPSKNVENVSGKDSEKDSEKNSEKTSGKDSEDVELEENSEMDSKYNAEFNYEKDSLNDSEEGGLGCEDPTKDCENDSANSATEGIQDIVDEVNAEAKRDIKGYIDASGLPLVSQKEPADDRRQSDDLCIDQMTWIDLTRHHGDVVKRRSAAFESVCEERNRTAAKSDHDYEKSNESSEARSDLVASAVGTRDKEEISLGVAPLADEKMLTTRHQEDAKDGSEDPRKACDQGKRVAKFSTDVPKLDLEQLTNDKLLETLYSPNSIAVEDYTSWESSSVRDRTRILENIIAKTGGSFPSPRSRAVARTEEEEAEEGCPDVQAGHVELSPSKKNLGVTHSCTPGTNEDSTQVGVSSCPGRESSPETANDDELLGDETVRGLVDKFEGRNVDSKANGDCQNIGDTSC